MFNTSPCNPYPINSETLNKLNEAAKAIDNMPTFTSNDKAFLEELPAFPSEDGEKVLTATTSSGETILSYETPENELPANPTEDGVRVLTATTESGSTVKSWEEKESGFDYSTTEQKTGQKWIDGRDIYSITVDNTTDLVVQSNTWTNTTLEKGSIDLILNVLGTSNGGSSFPLAGDKGESYIRINSWRNDTVSVRYIVFFYVKTATV